VSSTETPPNTGGSPSAASGSTRRAWTRIRSVGAVAVAVCLAVLVFVLRFNTLGGAFGGFDNDHFAQLIRAMEIRAGGLPLRDFADAEFRAWWPPLTYYASAAAQAVFGASLRSEAWLTVGAVAACVGVTVWLAARASESLLAAAVVGLLAAGLEPALYNYPKLLVATVMLGAMAAYCRWPGRAALVGLALATVSAELWRHDHGA